MKALLAVLAVLVVLGAGFLLYSSPTAPPAEMTEAEIAQIEAEVMEHADAWLGVFRGEIDCDAGLDLLHPDRLAMPYQGELLNRAEWHEMCSIRTANVAGVSMSWTKKEVRVLAPDAAVFIGSYSSTWEYRDDSPARHVPISSQIGVAERTPDGWVYTAYSYSDGPSEVVEEG
jgi:hypothetical protein